MLLQVVLERVEAHRQRPGLAERPQPQVDAIDEAVGGHRPEQLRDLLAETREILLELQRPRPVGLAVLRKQEHEIDVRREIELAAAELAHAEHQQLELAAILAAWNPRARAQVAYRMIAGRPDAGVGQQ